MTEPILDLKRTAVLGSHCLERVCRLEANDVVFSMSKCLGFWVVVLSKTIFVDMELVLNCDSSLIRA
ncbi:MAG: hypothetical protein MJK14_18015 [Rivularia sp. ALOHA_DT_140]|nr:hypothetical protein [Rivularia sp. ALOHA_DT_140]